MGPDEHVAALLERGALDEAATAALRALGPAVLRYLRGTLEEEDARDVFSALAEDVWRGLPGFRFECSLRAWTFRLARHAASRFLRDPWQRRVGALPDSAASRLAASLSSGSAPGGRRDALRALRKRLAPEEQSLLALRIDGELEWDEVASVLSSAGAPIDPAALRKRFERIKARIVALARDDGLIE